MMQTQHLVSKVPCLRRLAWFPIASITALLALVLAPASSFAAASYPAAVQSYNPIAYYRFSDCVTEPRTYETRTYTYTGAPESFTVPAGVTRLRIEAKGGQGGAGATGGNSSSGGLGGLGSKATGILTVTPGQVLNLFVGGLGGTPAGGYNGGGTGGSVNAGGGGGASDVRLGGTAVANRILVAGGGGGGGRGGCELATVNGGNGGGTNGANGTTSPSGGGGFGATGPSGGAAGIGCPSFLGSAGASAASEVGGNGGAGQSCCCFSAPSIPGGGGGGGGYVGGGGGGGGSAGTTGCSFNEKGGGGGGAAGSSYVDPAFASPASSFDQNTGDGSIIITILDTRTYTYTGSPESFTVPAGVTRLRIEANGAQGGAGATGGNSSSGGLGGLGSKATGILAVTPGQVLTLFVGGQGGTPAGGYNGGATGGSANAGGGGGASDIRIGGTGVANRYMVAGGGGGGGRGGCEPATVNGGNGGGVNGANGTTSPNGGGGFGATGTSGGAAGIGCGGFLGSAGASAASEVGGNGGAGQSCCCLSAPSIPGGGGGGGGYVGGGGGGGGSAGTPACSGNDKGGGGGGAAGGSYVDPAFASPASSFDQNAGDGSITITILETRTYTFTGAPETFTVPAGVTQLGIEANGAQGGAGATGGNSSSGGLGGLGSKATGILAVTPGQVLTLFVGGQGGTPAGGYNGGGTGGSVNAGGGGGASDIRIGGTGVANRYMVAGGGGGGGRGGCEPATVNGGNGGGTNGANGTTSPSGGGGFGATGPSGGAAGIGCPSFLGSAGASAASEVGGNGGAGQSCCCFSAPSIPGGGGGGGGYGGGGGGGGGSAGTPACSGNNKGGGGGGAAGSSYVDPAFASPTSSFDQNAGAGSITITFFCPPTFALNDGGLGAAANGSYLGGATFGAEAPRPPAYIGFEADNTALQLDGVDDFVATVPGLLNSKPSFTVMGWLRRGGVQASRAGLFGQNNLAEFGYIDDTTLECWTDNALDVPNPFPDGEWDHVAMVHDGSPGTLTMYTNGLLAGSRASTLPADNGFTFKIGGGGIFDAAGNYFKGQIDEVAVFDQALSSEKICTLYHTAVGLRLAFTAAPGGLTLTWACGTLQYTDALLGIGTVWTDVPGAVSPYPVTPGNPQRFYRVRL